MGAVAVAVAIAVVAVVLLYAHAAPFSSKPSEETGYVSRRLVAAVHCTSHQQFFQETSALHDFSEDGRMTTKIKRGASPSQTD